MIQSRVKPVSKSDARDTQPSRAGGNTTSFLEIMEYPSVDVWRHRGAINQSFGFADNYIFIEGTLWQENWACGLYINYNFTALGVADLIVAITQESTQELYLKILDRLSKESLPISQGVLA